MTVPDHKPGVRALARSIRQSQRCRWVYGVEMDQQTRSALSHLVLAVMVGVIGAVVAVIGHAARDPAPFADNGTADTIRGVGLIVVFVALVMLLTGLWLLAKALGQPPDAEDADAP